MADRKITEFGAITPANTAGDDVLPVVDISEALGDDKNKKITLDNLSKCISDGAEATPSIAFRDDQDTGIFSPSANNLAATTGGSERLRIDSSGRLLINKTSTTASHKLQVDGSVDLGGILVEKSSSNENISIGSGFASLASEAELNTAVGLGALESLTSGEVNTAIGYDALRDNDTGTSNVAVGYGALRGITSGTRNTGVGNLALLYCDTESFNSAFGNNCFSSLGTGEYNAGFGVQAGGAMSAGQYNTLVGSLALADGGNKTGVNYNSCLGYKSMYSADDNAVENTAIGAESLLAITTGSYNTCLGSRSGEDITTGSGNIVIGDRNASGTSAPVHTITTADNRVVMGTTAVTNAYIQVAWTVVSDERDKTNFGDVPHGIEFVKALNPIAFQFREDRESDVATGPVRYGFSAQEIIDLEGANPVIIDNEDPNRLKYRGESLVPVLVNAIKEQQEQIDALQARIDALEAVS